MRMFLPDWLSLNSCDIPRVPLNKCKLKIIFIIVIKETGEFDSQK